MLLPYELYLRFLATKGIEDISTVNDTLESFHLPIVSQDDLDRQWTLIHTALPSNVVTQIEDKKYSVDFMKNMQVLEIKDLWLYEPAFRQKYPENKSTVKDVKFVYEIHDNIWLRTCINALFIKKVSFEEISRILSSKFSITLTEKHLDIYGRYFFDISKMTNSLWKRYIKRYAGKEAHVYFTALTETIDVLKTELELPATVNISDSLQWLLTKSFLKAKSFIDMGTIEANREAREWIDQVVKLTDKYEKHRSGDQQDFAKSLQMEFEFIDDEFDTPDDEIAKEIDEKSRPKDSTQ